MCFLRVGVRSLLAFLVAGLGIPTSFAAEVQYPLSIAATNSDVVYFADRELPGVWKLEGGNLTVFFQGSKKFRTPLNAVRCVAIDREGKLWAGDSATREVYRLDGVNQAVPLTQKADASTSESAAPKNTQSEKPDAKSSGKDEPAKEKATAKPERPKFLHGEIGIPMDIAFDKAGNLFVSDLELHRIVHVTKDGGTVKQFAAVNAPRGICLDDRDNLWVVSGRRLVRLNSKGDSTTIVDNGTFEFPHTVAVADDQTAYVCDGYAKAIWKIPAGGKPEKLVAGDPFVNPVGMRLIKDKLYVVDPRAKAMFQVSLDKKITTVPLKTNQP